MMAMFFATKQHVSLSNRFGSRKVHAAISALHHQFWLIEPWHCGFFCVYRTFLGTDCPHHKKN
ncbi:MAG: hypothetical protein HHJ09_06385 [Glaciimonas sp.]|nr:hypothetical protein [Glaciimonas sp.]